MRAQHIQDDHPLNSNFSWHQARLKRAAKWLLPLVILLAVFSLGVQAQTTTGTTADGLIWSATNSQVTITGYNGFA